MMQLAANTVAAASSAVFAEMLRLAWRVTCSKFMCVQIVSDVILHLCGVVFVIIAGSRIPLIKQKFVDFIEGR